MQKILVILMVGLILIRLFDNLTSCNFYLVINSKKLYYIKTLKIGMILQIFVSLLCHIYR
jgi:hypothetical protein